jgi:uncharacterized membrane protein YbhN (UPF0104 family)
MKRLLALLGLAVSLVCIFFFARAIAHHWHAITTSRWSAATWASISIALALYLGTYSITSYAWNCSLCALGHPFKYRTALQILVLSQIAKYLPGNVGHHVGRVVLTKRAGLPADVVLGSMILDTLVVLMAAGLCSLSAFELVAHMVAEHGARLRHILEILVLVGLCCTMVALLTPLTRRAIQRMLRHAGHLIHVKNLPLFVKALLSHATSLLVGGTALYILCTALAEGPYHSYWFGVTGIFAAAWLLGFLIPGAPAGLGVREVALSVGLSPIFGAETAVAAAGVLRLVTTLGDGIAFGLGVALKRFDQHRMPASASSTDNIRLQ